MVRSQPGAVVTHQCSPMWCWTSTQPNPNPHGAPCAAPRVCEFSLAPSMVVLHALIWDVPGLSSIAPPPPLPEYSLGPVVDPEPTAVQREPHADCFI